MNLFLDENIISSYFRCIRDMQVTYLIKLLRVHNHIVCPALSVSFFWVCYSFVSDGYEERVCVKV